MLAQLKEFRMDVGINFSPPQSNMRENAHANDTARGLASPMNTLGITIFCNETHSQKEQWSKRGSAEKSNLSVSFNSSTKALFLEVQITLVPQNLSLLFRWCHLSGHFSSTLAYYSPFPLTLYLQFCPKHVSFNLENPPP